ncbi:MAG: DUF6337 family protein [Christensenellaceae bacterium]|jgi:oligosaccharide repeat unit polymerase|nr:DUF6337 family protein [Christensenellaceae bacterium]
MSNAIFLFLSIVYLIGVVFAIKLEQSKDNLVTPIFAIALPYGIVMFVVALFAVFRIYTSYTINFNVALYSICATFVFFIVGRIKMRSPRIKRESLKMQQFQYSKDGMKLWRTFLTVFFLFSSITTITMLILYYLYTIGFALPSLSSEQLRQLGSAVPIGNLINADCAFLLIFFASSYTDNNKIRKILYRTAAFAWILVLLLFSSKYLLFIYVCSLIIIHTQHAKAITYKTFFKTMCALVVTSLLFFVVYIIRHSIDNMSDTVDSAIQRFYYYIASGFYGFSGVLDGKGTPTLNIGILFMPAINFFRSLLWLDPLNPISSFISVDVIPSRHETNVYTLFGVFVLEIGATWTIFAVVLLALIVYHVYTRPTGLEHSSRKAFTAFVLAILMFAFFNSFYALTNIWDIWVHLALLTLIEKCTLRAEQKIKIPTNDASGETCTTRQRTYYVPIMVRKSMRHIASGKARLDAEKVFKACGLDPIAPSSKALYDDWKFMLWTSIKTAFSFSRLSLLYNTRIFIQYPIQASEIILKALKKAAIENELCFLIHDIDALRSNKGLADEIAVINLAKWIIVHSTEMRDILIEHGASPKMIVLGIFDYMTSNSARKTHKMSDGVTFAGNLEKSKFLREFADSNIPLTLNCYGNSGEYDMPKSVFNYMGIVPSEVFPNTIEGAFGLVWDGESVDGCNGYLGEYLKYNSPHKASLYIVSGMPIIAWNRSAVGHYVKENGIGITVDSLREIPEVIAQVTDESYTQMILNIDKVATKMRTGMMLGSAVIDIITKSEKTQLGSETVDIITEKEETENKLEQI